MNCASISSSVVRILGFTSPAGLALCLCLLSVEVLAETRISVLYPDASAPLNQLYQTIIDGIAGGSGVSLESRAVSDRDSATDVRAWIEANQSQVAIVLGNVPVGVTQPLAAAVPLIHGADALNDNTLTGVSLASSPSRMFNRLRGLKPDIERVFVVYRPADTGWLIDVARTAAREQGLELTAIACDDVHQAGAAFTHILQQTRPGKDAIWLTLDPVVPINQILPVLLRESWEKNLVLFSNNPVDVAKGALFALYPDYKVMGRQLADRAKRQLTKPVPVGPEASEHLNGALNIRTASHLGITLSDRQQQAFSRIFPEGRK